MCSDTVAGLILAAGYSRRLGKQNKRTVSVHGSKTLLATTLSRVTGCFTHWRVPVLVMDVLLVEKIWVLAGKRYRLEREAIAGVISALFESRTSSLRMGRPCGVL